MRGLIFTQGGGFCGQFFSEFYNLFFCFVVVMCDLVSGGSLPIEMSMGMCRHIGILFSSPII